MNMIVAGAGVVTPIGIGNVRFIEALAAGSSGIRLSDRYGIPCGEMTASSVDELLKDRRFRRAASCSRQAILAVRLALEDAGLESVAGPGSGLILATMHGALNYTQEFHREVVQESVDGVSPILFSDSVMNAASGNISLCYGIKGQVHTIIGGQTAFIKALCFAEELLAQNGAETVIVAASEELNEIGVSCYSRLGSGPLAEGSGALVLKRQSSGAPAPCIRICCTASHCNPANPESALRHAVSRCLAAAKMVSSDVDFVVTDITALPESLAGIPAFSVTALTGQAFAASAAWHVTAAVLMLRNGGASETVLVCSEDAEGVASAVIVARGVQDTRIHDVL